MNAPERPIFSEPVMRDSVGMTMRDRFALAALRHSATQFTEYEVAAAHAYKLADAMIKERAK